MEEELPPEVLAKLAQIPAAIRDEYRKDLLQETRFSVFVSSNVLLEVDKSLLMGIQHKYGRFLVASAREWFISIPLFQCVRSRIVHKYLRLVLSELLGKNIIQKTEGWNFHIIYLSLILWARSPIPYKGVTGETQIDLPVKQSLRCAYCENNWRCMAKDKTKCTGRRFLCHTEAGVHLCEYHGNQVFSEERPLGVFVDLEDERRMWGVGRVEFMDKVGMRIHDYEKHKVALNDFGEYQVQPLLSPLPEDWFMHGKDELDASELLIRKKLDYPSQCFWFTEVHALPGDEDEGEM